jgi:hypothetical protein
MFRVYRRGLGFLWGWFRVNVGFHQVLFKDGLGMFRVYLGLV